MVASVELVLERGERLELLVDKTDNLQQQVCWILSLSVCHVEAKGMHISRCVLSLLLVTRVRSLLVFVRARLLAGESFRGEGVRRVYGAKYRPHPNPLYPYTTPPCVLVFVLSVWLSIPDHRPSIQNWFLVVACVMFFTA